MVKRWHVEVFKAKAEPKEAEGKAIAMPVWLTFEGRRYLELKGWHVSSLSQGNLNELW